MRSGFDSNSHFSLLTSHFSLPKGGFMHIDQGDLLQGIFRNIGKSPA
ncbi:MAG: hypothetical protein GY749_44165 [Desulfobacteraceae bacterium]|nr:hypothetical protein [Desulfobacteraceae bacterium]